MLTTADILHSKGGGAVAIAPDATLHQAARAMCDLGIGSLVVGSLEDPKGCITERDLVKRLSVDPNAGLAQVCAAMGPVIAVAGEDDVDTVLRIMTYSRTRHVLVRLAGVYAGLVSIGDLVKAHSDQAQSDLAEMDSYLHDRPSAEVV